MAAALIAVRAVRAALSNTTSTGLSVTSASSYATKSGVNKQKKAATGGAGPSKPPSPPPSPTKSAPPAPGAGKNVDPPSVIFKKVEGSKIGPGASKDKEYKNPEYFMYHNMSFCEMEIIMAKLRLPQPSSLKK